MWELTYAVLLTVFLIFCWALTCIGLPGNWAIVAISLIQYAGLDERSKFYLSGVTIGAIVGLALLGELIEFLSGGIALKKGGSRKGAAYALVGSMIGAVVGTTLIPLIGAILFSAVGAFLGAWVGEIQSKNDPKKIYEIAKASFVGRLMGSLIKISIGTILVACNLIAVFSHFFSG